MDMLFGKKRKLSLVVLVILVVVFLAAGCGGTKTGDGKSNAPSYPVKPITLLVGFAAGGPADMVARAVADQASKSLGQPVSVVNKPGAAGTLATAEMVAAPADGYTLLMTTRSAIAIAPAFGVGKYGYKDITPVAKIASDEVAIFGGKNSPFKNMTELIAYAKQHPDKVLTYSSLGENSSPHLTVAEIGRITGIKLTHVPQKGDAPCFTAVMGGNIDFAVVSKASAIDKHKSGEVRILGILGPRRDPIIPDVPTIREQGIDTSTGLLAFLEEGFWYGIIGPKDLKEDVLKKWDTVLKQVSKDAKFDQTIKNLFFYNTYASGQEFINKTKEDGAKSEALVNAYKANKK